MRKQKKNSQQQHLQVLALPTPELEAFLTSIYKAISGGDSLPSSGVATPTNTGASAAPPTRMTSGVGEKEKSHALLYLETLCVHTEVANTIINSSLMTLMVRMCSKGTIGTAANGTTADPASAAPPGTAVASAALAAAQGQHKAQLVHIMGLLVRHATWIADELSGTGILQVLAELLRDKNPKVKRKAAAALGELLFYVATQQEALDPSERDKVWPVPKSTITILTRCLRSGEDDVVQHYVAKTVENISAQSSEFTRVWFAQQEVLYSLLHLYNTSRNESLRLTCASALSHLMRRMPALVNR
jgi:serine/threonine-protein kinase ULK4